MSSITIRRIHHNVIALTAGLDQTLPLAPIASWTSNAFDHTPNFLIQLPTGLGDGTDAHVGDVLFGERQTQGGDWSGATSYVSIVLQSADLVDGATVDVGSADLDPGLYDFRWRLQRSGVGNSDWSSTVEVTLSPPPTYVVTFVGGFHSGGEAGNTLSHSFSVGTSPVFLVACTYSAVGDPSDAAPTISVGATGMDLLASRDHAFEKQANIFSKSVTSGSGTETFTATYGASNNGQPLGMFIWAVTGLVSTTAKQTVAGARTGSGGAPVTIPVDIGDLLIAVTMNQVDPGTYVGFSSEDPEEEHKDDAFVLAISAYFKSSDDNSAFNIEQQTINNSATVAATFQ